ncbi:MAG: AraC family transcriptional regulator [Saprospiraceae bacterium]
MNLKVARPNEESPIFKTWELGGFTLGYARSNFNGLKATHTRKDEEKVKLHFGTKGDYRFTHFQLKKEFDLIGGHHNLMFSKGFEIEVFPKTEIIETFGLSFDKEYFISLFQNPNLRLKSFLDAIKNEKPIMYAPDWGSISSPIQRILNQVIHHGFKGHLEHVYLKAKSLELLALCLDQYDQAFTGEKVIKTEADKSKIIKVRDLLLKDFQETPTLSELSKLTGLNEFKLKNGFKEVFGTTVFAYLFEHKLQLAFQLLSQSDKTAAEISSLTGFSSPQHFNQAFKKRFGNTPKSIRKDPSNVIMDDLK